MACKLFGNNRICEGSEFQIEGATTENARCCRVEVFTHGTKSLIANRRGNEAYDCQPGSIYRATEFLQVNWGNALNLVGWVRPLDFGWGGSLSDHEILYRM